MKTRILFVCLGNICRSPAAEEIFRTQVARQALSDSIEADSAGTYSGHAGNLPDPRMRRAAARRGYELTHRARPLREADFERFDRIVVMDDNNYETAHRLAPSRELAGKIHRMTEFCRHSPQWDHVPDPYYEGHEGFELVLDLLEDEHEWVVRYSIEALAHFGDLAAIEPLEELAESEDEAICELASQALEMLH